MTPLPYHDWIAALLQFREFDRILARLADAAVERAHSDNRAMDVAFIAIERHNVGHLARTILAERSPAKDAHAMRRSFAVPAVHSNPPEKAVPVYATKMIVLQNGRPTLHRLWRCGKIPASMVRLRNNLGTCQSAAR